MRHPYEKLVRMELAAIAAVILFGVIALIQGFLLLILLAFYLLAFSLLCEAMLLWQTGNTPEAGKQGLRAMLLFIFVTYLFFRL
ncbi:hypothetical protein ACFOGI_00015 [Virgibacillus xinjiangensis]|uniref:Phosphatidate cytidylyltransferase n=1 Tax=Virgibacillus xinjiangensis TaxID=393090 RepID=A0ABV7CQM0_9BACI